MATIFADRFLRFDRLARSRTVDLATGRCVTLRLSHIGTVADQQAWAGRSAQALGVSSARTLVDFGLVARDRRFEAFRAWQPRARGDAKAPSTSGQVLCAQVVEWLEEAGASSSGILYLGDAAPREWVERVAREVRLAGFIPVGLALLDERRGTTRELERLLAGRSIVVLEDRPGGGDGAQLCRAFLARAGASARQTSALVNLQRGVRGSPYPLIAHAAEGRMPFGAGRVPALVEGRVIVDSRAMVLLDDGRRFARGGRHAAAERALRAAAAAFERRKDLLHAGDAAVQLGGLLLDRGRAADALGQFDLARDRYQERGAAAPALSASILGGVARTDLGQLERAGAVLRAAYSAAGALQDDEAVATAAVALARNCYWQGRVADAITLLDGNPPGAPARYWSVMSRLRAATGCLNMASECANRAREGLEGCPEPAVEAMVRAAHANVQARLGDIEALHFHVRLGLIAARAAHLPLQALRLRLTLLEGLLDAGLASRARVIGTRWKALERAQLPPLLKQRFDRVMARLSGKDIGAAALGSGLSARETAPAFRPDQFGGVAELFSLCHGFEDEREALDRAATIVRKQAGAVAAGVFGSAGHETMLLGSAGSLTPLIARRCIDLGHPIPAGQSATGTEAAVPIEHLGRIIGAIACRWTVEGPRGAEVMEAFARIAAAACAPIVQILLERHAVPAQGSTRGDGELVGVSAAIQEVRRLILRAANAPFTVLIEGESGSGKELVARAIHRAGCRRERPLCALNCAALTDELVDAELFGHAKGAFTGAVAERLGLFESATGGTVFLDEVGELSARAQAKLLRALQEGEIRRIGENFTRPIDARLVAATNRPLRAEVDAGRFRQDLWYRLDVIRIAVPPLRDRVEDIPLLASGFWRETVERIGSKAVLGQGALSALARYDWPGNVRELQNVLSGLAVAVPARGIVPASAMPAAIAHAMRPTTRETLDMARRRFEQRFVRAELARAAGHRGQTAAALGVSRQGLAKLMQRLQLEDHPTTSTT
jgi:DNA-binding NtrC family response regulator/tetratricopeptide (TPR) repeat protein